MLFDYFLADRRLGFVDIPGFTQAAVNRSPVDGVDHHIDIGIAGHQHPHRFPSLPAVASEKPRLCRVEKQVPRRTTESTLSPILGIPGGWLLPTLTTEQFVYDVQARQQTDLGRVLGRVICVFLLDFLDFIFQVAGYPL
jgi:hypothetical protein